MPAVGVTIPGVGVSLACGASLGTATPYFNYGGESLLGIQVSLGTTIFTVAPPAGSTGILDFTRGTSAVYIVLFGGFP
jgi:hypothetical protein